MRLRKIIDTTLEWMLIVLMSALVLDVLWQVISRYIMSSPSSYTDELANYLFVWVGLLGAAYVAGKREHLAIDLLLQRSSAKRKYKLEIIISVLVVLFAIIVMIIGGSWLVYSRFFLAVKSAALGLPLGFVYLVLPISGLLISYFEIDHTYNMIKNKRENY